MIFSIPSQGASFHDSWTSNHLRHARHSPATYSNVIPLNPVMHTTIGWLGTFVFHVTGSTLSRERSLSSFTGFYGYPIQATRPVWADPTVKIITGGWYDIYNQQFITSYEDTYFPFDPSYITSTTQSRLSASRKGFMWLEIASNSLGQILTSQSLEDNPIYIKSPVGFSPYTVTTIGVSGVYNNTFYSFMQGHNNLWPYLFPSSIPLYVQAPNWSSLTLNLQPIRQVTSVINNTIRTQLSNINNTSLYYPTDKTNISFTSTAVGFGNLSSSSSTSTIYIDEDLITLCTNMSAAVDSRLVGKNPTNSKKVFSTANHTTRTYVRNTNLWCADLVQQLTGMVTYKTAFGVNDSFGGTLITPRHILYVQHALPRGGTVRFVTSNNQTITAIQLSGSNINVFANSTTYPVFPSLSAVDPLHYDMAVITLDRDVSLSGISPLPIAAITSRERTILRLQPAPTIAISQGSNRTTGTTNPNPLSAREMELYTLNTNIVPIPNTSTKYPWAGNGGGHIIWDGDSGTSHLIVNNNSVYLYRLTYSATGHGVHVAALSSQVNYLIKKSDELAGVNTGLSATFYSIKQILER